jgi:hypothetical protein
MPDNSVKIAKLDAILQSGVRTVSVDGVTTSIDLDAVRKERDRLIADDNSRANDRPRACGINLGSF